MSCSMPSNMHPYVASPVLHAVLNPITKHLLCLLAQDCAVDPVLTQLLYL
jgi:hypothetical protein